MVTHRTIIMLPLLPTGLLCCLQAEGATGSGKYDRMALQGHALTMFILRGLEGGVIYREPQVCNY